MLVYRCGKEMSQKPKIFLTDEREVSVMCMRNETIEKRLAERAELKEQIDILDAKVADIDKELKEDLDKRGVEVYEFPGHKISNKTIESASFDTKKFKEDYPELYAKYCSVKVSKRFTVK